MGNFCQNTIMAEKNTINGFELEFFLVAFLFLGKKSPYPNVSNSEFSFLSLLFFGWGFP